jgi:hypothetical protein
VYLRTTPKLDLVTVRQQNSLLRTILKRIRLMDRLLVLLRTFEEREPTRGGRRKAFET